MSFSPDTYKQKKNELETQKAEAEASFDGEQVGKIDKELADLEAAKAVFESKSEKAGDVTEGQIQQINNLGGNIDEVNGQIAEKTEEMRGVKQEASEKVESLGKNDQDPFANLKNTYGSAEKKQELMNRLQAQGIGAFNSDLDISLAEKMRDAGIISPDDLGNGILVSLNSLFQKYGGNTDRVTDEFATSYLRHMDSSTIKFLEQNADIKGLIDKVVEGARKKIQANDPNRAYYENLVAKIGM